MKEHIYPPRVWLAKWWRSWKPVDRGSDEWGRHTLVLAIPFVAGVVIPWKWCACEEFREFQCPWPKCPALAISPGCYCPTHDPEWFADDEGASA